MKHLPIYYILFIFWIHISLTQKVYIVIHGTWGIANQWFAPGGNFYEALAQAAPKSSVVPFCWTGAHSHNARMQAAHMLCALISSYTQKTKFILVGHSHGGTIAIHASHILAESNSPIKIEALFTLGTPICCNTMPNMHTIKQVYNFFSFDDYVQRVLGAFKREFSQHERIENIRLMLHKKTVGHSLLHHPHIGQLIPSIPELITDWRTQDKHPILLYICNDGRPLCCADIERESFLIFR